MFPDHYKTLGIAPVATLPEVKAAYRSLAAKYHPDKAAGNPFAENHFKEIAAAYRTLSDAGARRKYDEERWLRGLSACTKYPVRISPAWLIVEAKKLETHLREIDTARMDQAALRDYISLLLSNEHLSVWQAEATGDERKQLTTLLLAAAGKLSVFYLKPLRPLLESITGNNPALRESVRQLLWQKAREARRARLLPLIVLLAAIIICAVIAFITKGR